MATVKVQTLKLLEVSIIKKDDKNFIEKSNYSISSFEMFIINNVHYLTYPSYVINNTRKISYTFLKIKMFVNTELHYQKIINFRIHVC